MRTLFARSVAGILFLCVFTFAKADEEGLKSGPQPGTKSKPNRIPGSFQAWIVTGPQARKVIDPRAEKEKPEKGEKGEDKGEAKSNKTVSRYHSLVCAYGLNPAAMIFLKDLNADDKALLLLMKKLDTLAVKHPDARFGCGVININDGGFREALEKEDDDFAKRLAETGKLKDDLEKKLIDLAQSEKLNNIDFCLDSKSDLKDYQLNEEAQITILYYNKHIVLGSFAYKDKLKEEDVDPIASEIEKLVVEVERLSRPVYRKVTK